MGDFRFFIILTIFIFPFLRQEIIFPAVKQAHWNIGDNQWDKRRLRNRGPYLVEGKGGMQVLIGESEPDIRKVLGEPTRRSYGDYDILFYERRTYSGEVWLRKGFVVRIVYFVKKQSSVSLEWNTALGLRQSQVEDLTRDEAVSFILNFYENPRHLVNASTLNIHSRGILFRWGKTRLRTIEIFEPWDYY